MAKEQLRVSPEEVGLRVDRLLGRRHSGLSRRALRLAFEAGQVSINGRPARKGDAVAAGDVVDFDADLAEVVARPAPADGARLVLVTEHLVILDKPAGVPSVAVPGRLEGTAAGQLLTLFPELAGIGYGPREPGLVHRLDTYTSGLLLAARSKDAFAELRQAMQKGAIEKRYVAIACGSAPEHGRIDRCLEPDPHDQRRVRTTGGPASRQATVFRCLERRGEHSLLEVTLARGYRHQIRAHLASIGLPLAGDVLYGGADAGLGPRHALHASLMQCAQPALAFRAEAELPGDLQGFWASLG